MHGLSKRTRRLSKSFEEFSSEHNYLLNGSAIQALHSTVGNGVDGQEEDQSSDEHHPHPHKGHPNGRAHDHPTNEHDHAQSHRPEMLQFPSGDGQTTAGSVASRSRSGSSGDEPTTLQYPDEVIDQMLQNKIPDFLIAAASVSSLF